MNASEEMLDRAECTIERLRAEVAETKKAYQEMFDSKVRVNNELAEKDKPCEWKQDLLPEHEPWETSCGDAWCLDDGDPILNRMNFCPSCGHPLKVVSNE